MSIKEKQKIIKPKSKPAPDLQKIHDNILLATSEKEKKMWQNILKRLENAKNK